MKKGQLENFGIERASWFSSMKRANQGLKPSVDAWTEYQSQHPRLGKTCNIYYKLGILIPEDSKFTGQFG